MEDKKFNELYGQLNPKQREAVDAVEGPVMVIAGPGTGKTQILTLRIANILRLTDVPPESILALTFTESGVYSMRRRLVEIIGSHAYRVTISTFHGFCNDVIKRYPEEFPRIIGSTNITEVEEVKIFRSLIALTKLARLSPYGDEFYYLRHIVGAVDDLKREGIDDAHFQKLIKAQERRFWDMADLYHEGGIHGGKMRGKYKELLKEIEKNKELAALYEKYEETLKKERLYDYNDMIIEVLKVLGKNDDLLLTLQEKYQYILADEHQDANNAQNKVLELLSNFHPNPNIFIVGDEKQAIFRFQGASLNNFLYFKRLYPEAKVVTLKDNYRSSQIILDSSHSLILKNATGTMLEDSLNLKVRLRSAKGGPLHLEEPILLYEFQNPQEEYYFLAKNIEERVVQEHTELDPRAFPSIALIYRDNADAHPVAEALERMRIPFTIESEQNILEDEDIGKIILILKTVHEIGSDELFARALHIDFLNVDPLDIYKIVDYATKTRDPILHIVRRKEALEKLHLASEGNILDFAESLLRWKKHAINKSLSEMLEIVFRESGFIQYILSSNDVLQKMEKVNAFFDEGRRVAERHKNFHLLEFLEYLAMLEEQKIMIKKKWTGEGKRGVRLMTAHKSKGQEFDFVYIINAHYGHWGNRKRGSHFFLPIAGEEDLEREFTSDDDERRLFYVALTRARRKVTVSHARRSKDERELIASRFISEIDPQFIEKGDARKYEEEFKSHPEFNFLPRLGGGIRVKDREFVREIFLKRGISVTALNNYLECPWKYFYNNLLRVPRAKNKYQMYGTAIHDSLHALFKILSEGDTGGKETLIKLFEDALNKEPVLEKDYGKLREKGKVALSGYYDTYASVWNTNVITEFEVRGVELAPDVKITGKIDKIEFTGEGNSVTVVDYKTGKPKSRNEIEGRTKNSRGDYKRQLIFYKLILDMHAEKKYLMSSGEIDFVEPNDRGKYKKEGFTISDDEVVELRELVLKVSNEILNLSFWERRCEKGSPSAQGGCEFCSLRDMMK